MGSGRSYTCRQGDCISSIAARFGLPGKLIWEHPDNAELKQLRGDPNVLLPGDKVFVPEPGQRPVSAQTGGSHSFTFTAPRTRLKVRLQAGGAPRKNKAYTLVLDDGTTLTGTTDADGLLDAQIPARAREATVRIEVPGLGTESLVLRLGHLDPVTEVSGVQQRLCNLGFHCEASGVLDEDTRAALALFQEAQGLEPTGKLDDGARDAIRKACGS